jgi:putative heme iron utilization protein
MKKLSDEIIHFFKNQGFVVISTIDQRGMPHNSCKGIVAIQSCGRIFLLDVYLGQTFKNLKYNPHASITAVDEHKFKGYCLKGKANLIAKNRISKQILRLWDERITSRLTQRLIKNIKEERGHVRHPEALLPGPQYMIEFEVKEIVDLTPHHLR